MDASCVVVFPTVFARGSIPRLIRNIKGILRTRDLQFSTVKRDGDVILVHAHDPVFASSAINMLFGIRRIAIARQTGSSHDEIVACIADVGGSLLLRGERFLVRVEGAARGFIPKDAEVAATSRIIETRSNLGASPGTDADHDKLLYAYITKNHAYVCIFTDEGGGGVPYMVQERRAVCAIYDEISAVACYETIKQGYDARIIVCYRQGSELADLARAASHIIPRLVRDTVDLEFFELKVRPTGIRNYLTYTRSVLEILLRQPEPYVSLALSPLIFPADSLEVYMKRVLDAGRIPIMPLAGVDSGMFEDLVEVGLGRNANRLERIASMNVSDVPQPAEEQVSEALGTVQKVTVQAGPNSMHDILDSLERDHRI